ncbi:MAG: DUF4265 domain-containing protein [Solirubrobacteraceae bacterium]|nr:DUF4265 domain-containing protein [Solirubrobacteraceae bacterium]
MAEIEEHPSKATTWVDGVFVVSPEADRSNVTVWVSAEAHTDGAVKWELLSATKLSADRARLTSVPFFVYDLAYGDDVILEDQSEGDPVGAGVGKASGNETFRVVFDGARADDDRWVSVMVDLEHLGCWFDIRGPGFMALSASAEHAAEVATYLAEREEDEGDLRFETGRSSDRVTD